MTLFKVRINLLFLVTFYVIVRAFEVQHLVNQPSCSPNLFDRYANFAEWCALCGVSSVYTMQDIIYQWRLHRELHGEESAESIACSFSSKRCVITSYVDCDVQSCGYS